ncbi:hypothetical protein ACFQZ1_08505 [Bacillus sp. CGMCC 1.60114]|uniref:hypothetical protein n=1 Tax=unclassified Bacillus (in: firmicutes) TaxID=185979 RepID=UPI0036431425
MNQNANHEKQHGKEVEEKVEIYCAKHRNCCGAGVDCPGEYKYFSNTGTSVFNGICC